MSSVFHRQTENRGCRRSCGQVPSQVRHIRQKLKITLSRRYLILLSLLPVVAVALLALTPDNAWAAKKKKTEEPELFGDAALGHKYHRQIVATYGTYDNDNGLAGYVQQVGEEIATHADGESFAWHFTILDSESINAFALPGGFIYITRALLTHLNSEAQLAAVLGHEIAHSASRHSSRQQAAASVVGNVAAAIESNNSGGFNLSQLFGAGLVRGYGRDMELEADELGMKMISAAGYDPAAMFEVIEVIKAREQYELSSRADREKDTKNKAANRYHAMLSSHPDKDRRLRELAAAQKTAGAGTRDSGRDEFLRYLEGTAWSGSARQGIIRGREFLHADMNFAITFPDDWVISNLPDRLVASPPDGAAFFQLTSVARNTRKLKKLSVDEFLPKAMNINRWQNARVLKVNGLDAFMAISPNINSRMGERIGRIAAVYIGDSAFILLGFTKEAGMLRRYDAEFIATIKTLRTLEGAELALAQPQKITIVDLPADSGLEQYANVAGVEDPLALLRLINGYYQDGEPAPGSPVKVIR